MGRIAAFVYGALAYVVFLLTFLYAIAFVGNLGVPRSIDQPPGSFSAAALLIDVLLLGSFAVQHSVMARPRFKRVWTRVIPEPIGEGEEQVSRSCPGRRSTRIASLRDSPDRQVLR